MKVLVFLFILPLISGDRIVKTTNGPVRGTSLAPKKVEAFLGIPYAEPPVGPLRFARPVPKSSWKKTYEANELPPTCVQALLGKIYFAPDPDEEMSEDCLYLNLWVPEGGSDLKPIMLFIHGGGFIAGTSNMKIYDGATLSEHGDVIVVTINYRVGTLGFFSGSIKEAAGSMGMYDQVMAFQWIKDNAKHFGGDPDKIVLFGESAGGFSISMHMLSPLSKNLFRRAILQSGTAFHPMFDNNNELEAISQTIAKGLGCADDDDSLSKNPKDVVDCMKALSPEKFSEADVILLKSGKMILPVIGDEFLPESTIDSFNKGTFKDTELLLGITRDEGTLLLAFQLSGELGILGEKSETVDFSETRAKQFIQHLTQMDEDDKIIKQYLDRVNKESEYTYLKATAEVLGDLMISCGTVYQADYHSLRDNPVYFYLFDYRAPSSPLAKWIGVAHFDEIQYVFGNPAHREFTENEIEFSRDLMDMWAAFARTGNPNIPGGVEWPRYTYKDPKYFVISKRDRVDVKPDNHRCEAWRKLFRSVIDEDTIQRLKKSA